MLNTKSIRRDLGLQLRIFRRNQQLSLEQVAKRTEIPIHMLDAIEFGYPRAWFYYRVLFDFYQCEIKLVKKE